MNYALANPMYGPPEPEHVRSLRKAILVAERRGYHLVKEVGALWTHLIAGRNLSTKAVLADERKPPEFYEGVLWVDADVTMDADAIVRLLAGVEYLKLDFASGCYYKRAAGHEPTWGEIRGVDSDGHKQVMWMDSEAMKGWQVFLRGACGFGFVWTSTNLLGRVSDPTGAEGPFTKLPWWGEPGDDYSFCDRVASLSNPTVPLWVNHDIQLGHVGNGKVWAQADFLAGQISKRKGAENLATRQPVKVEDAA